MSCKVCPRCIFISNTMIFHKRAIKIFTISTYIKFLLSLIFYFLIFHFRLISMFIRHRLQGEYLSIICMHKFFKRPTPDKFEKFSLLQMQMASFLTCHRKMIIISPFIEIKLVSRKF